MSGPFLLAQLSDPHIGAHWGDGDPVAGFAAAVETVLAMPLQPDAVLVSGDLADNATDAEYEQARELLALLEAPLYVLPGNHDDRRALRRHFDGFRGVLRFLQHVPDRGRAEQAFERVGRLLFDRDMVALDPDAEGEVHTPLDFAPNPDSIARRLFDEGTIEAHLDHLAESQADDGGWTFNWLAWSPIAEGEWRGSLTVDVLRTFRANDHL
jgi:hypothetical protein